MEKFRNISENTIRHLSLHDCFCTRMYREGNALIFEMEWMEILPSHPHNPYEQAHQSGRGRIVLSDAVMDQGVLIQGENMILLTDQTAVSDFELLTFNEECGETDFELSLFGENVGEPEADYIEMKIRYSASQVMFNELGAVSWFESV